MERNKIRGNRKGQEARIYAPYLDTPKKSEPLNWEGICIANGENNDYSERIENHIEHSINATMVSNLFKRFLIGQGDEALYKQKANENQTYEELIDDIADEYKDHRGFYVLVQYNPLGERKGFKHIPFTQVRITDVDSNNNPAKFVIRSNWQRYQEIVEENKDDRPYKFRPFNPDPEVVQAQIKSDGGFSKFKGQIFYYNGGKKKYHYPLAFIHSVINECDSDFRIQLQRNQRIRNGFMNHYIIMGPPQIDPQLRFPDSQLSKEDLIEKRRQEEAPRIEEILNKSLGSENPARLTYIEAQNEDDNIKELFDFIELKASDEDGLFEKNENQIKTNIRKAYFNPKPILLDEDKGITGSSGEAMREAMEFYEKNVNHEKIKFSKALERVFGKTVQFNSLLEDKIIVEDE